MDNVMFEVSITFDKECFEIYPYNIMDIWDDELGTWDLPYLPSVNDTLDVAMLIPKKISDVLFDSFGTTFLKVTERIWTPNKSGMYPTLVVIPSPHYDANSDDYYFKEIYKETNKPIFSKVERDEINSMLSEEEIIRRDMEADNEDDITNTPYETDMYAYP